MNRVKKPQSVINFLKKYDLSLGKHGNFVTLTNPKTGKSDIFTVVMHLHPTYKGTCPFAGTCAAVCLNLSGNPAYLENKIPCRLRRTDAFFDDQNMFLNAFLIEMVIQSYGLSDIAMRGNGTSDIKYEDLQIDILTEVHEYIEKLTGKTIPLNQLDCSSFIATVRSYIEFITPGINFYPYDYTKRTDRDLQKCAKLGYHLTMSWGSKADTLTYAIENKLNIAVPAKLKKSSILPASIRLADHTLQVYSGDFDDFRPADPKGNTQVCLLRFKKPKIKGDKATSQAKIDAFCVDNSTLIYAA